MILSESLWPGMTRHGFGFHSSVRIKPADRKEFPVTKNGLWLPLASVAIKEFEIAKSLFRQNHLNDSMARAAFSSMECERDTGCWVSSSISTEEEHTLALWDIADQDMGGVPLNPIADKESLRVCDTPGCLNARHYDLTHKKPYRDRLLKPDYEMYEVLEDESIRCSWEEDTGVVLPSVEGSKDIFRQLQARCVPYVDDPSLAPLTANGISKLTIDEITGCMPVRMYYTSPNDFGKNFMYDGYGRIGVGPGLRKPGEPAYQQMAHRVTYRAAGGEIKPGWEINHECGFHPCANPGHLTQMTRSENIRHMISMQRARARRVQPYLFNGAD